MKLFNVQVEAVMVVQADNETHAYEVARRHVGELEGDEMSVFVEGEIKTVKDLKDGWDEICIPFGDDGESRIGDLLARTQS